MSLTGLFRKAIISEFSLSWLHNAQFQGSIPQEIHDRIYTALREIPIVIFTVLVQEESERKALELGAAAYVTKPFDVDEVITCIRRILP